MLAFQECKVANRTNLNWFSDLKFRSKCQSSSTRVQPNSTQNSVRRSHGLSVQLLWVIMVLSESYSWHHNQYHRDLHTTETIKKVGGKMREKESIINGCLRGFYCVIFGERYWLILPRWEKHNTRSVSYSLLWQQPRPAFTALTEEI